MIDFEKELNKFNFIDMDASTGIIDNEAINAIDAFNAVLKRLSKDQSNANTQLEELVELAAEKVEKDCKAEEFNKQMQVCEDEKLALVKGFIEILDQIEDLYRYSAANDYGNWSTQIRLLWENINNHLIISGVTRIEGLNTTFNPFLCTVKMTRDEPDVQEGLILDVLRCGYMYKGSVIRKAEVVVNKRNTESEYYEQDCGNRLWNIDI